MNRDESVARIQILDQEIKKLRDQVKALERKNEDAEAEISGLKSELEELAPFREAALEQRTLNAEEPTKVKELNSQITELEDTRDVQAAMIEELESKITTVEAEALAFKGKAELEYEALSDGFKVLKTRRSEEIRALKAELEQHKLQEQIIEKLQADIDGLQAALALVANSQSTENARINQVTAELNEALALKDQEVVQVRQNMTEFEESHNRLVSSLQATLATINEEADSARKSRDEAVSALESLKEELEALRHSLPINNKHMSLSEWSAEQQEQQQQEQLKVIENLEVKLESQVEGVKEDQQRANVLGANTKRKSQQLALHLEQHLQLSNAMVKSSLADQDQHSSQESGSTLGRERAIHSSDKEGARVVDNIQPGTVSVRTMLKFLSQLQGRSFGLMENHKDASSAKHHVREGTDATIAANESESLEEQLRVYLTRMDDKALLEPWGREKELELEIDRLEQKIQTLLSDPSRGNGGLSSEAQAARAAELQAKESILQDKEKLLLAKAEDLEDKEQQLNSKAQDLKLREAKQAKDDEERHNRSDPSPITPPFSAPMTPFGSPGNVDMLPEFMGAHHQQQQQLKGQGITGNENGGDDDNDDHAANTKLSQSQDEHEKRQQAEMAAQHIKLIKSLEEKIAELEKRAGSSPSSPVQEDGFPAPPTSRPSPGSPTSSRINSQMVRSTLLSNPPDTPPPTIALPPVPYPLELNEANSSRTSLLDDGSAGQESTTTTTTRRTKKSSMAHSISTESLSAKAATEAAIAAAVAAAVAKTQEANKELAEKLAQSEAELNKSREALILKQTNEAQEQQREGEMQRLRNENRELAQAMEEIRKSLDMALTQSRGLEGLKTQLELQVQQERKAKDEAVRAQDRLKTQLEEEMQKKKGFLCF
ncbi:hypothetical protein BGZ94_009820 [Podila epigama]|nr:hypothetical protein BGZ94_009820 [Podila epigama]